MSDMVKDILLKAAEDVSQGMWCQEFWFKGHDQDERWDESDNPAQVFEVLSVEQMQRSKRCAEGSIVLAARLLGGSHEDAQVAMSAAAKNGGKQHLFSINDSLDEGDPFAAGQTLAELFRSTAEAL